MRKVIVGLTLVCLVFAVNACLSNRPIDAAHNSRNSLNWEGVYTGVIPAASGPGINVRLTLHTDETYEIHYRYIDRQDSDFAETGTFKWNKAGSAITLDAADFPPHYTVGENTLIQLDMSGKPITGSLADNYVLRKMQ